ncbi:polyprenyl synthetase family protein [Chitinibacter bivalviorum]|uniref:Polyprenyl synthetase family protein n=1 Tax=Chitinibacter bivalviorum TaxID=2739434 RepID=A0A7H9BF17_9NEIS|nr:farnesyl diphosphate synthase [Chitinibacter bivalviorum]QLG87209.1 polyprenyl synthetase family protein [Chitinibacter bivalviorum]
MATDSVIDFKVWMSQVQVQMEIALDRYLPASTHIPERLHDAMRYSVLDGGKRVRPLLAFAAGALVDADPARLEAAGAALEMIHAYSLVHDDMPAMDNDVLRRGKPTVHVAFGEATALLAGDALQTAAFDVLSATTLTDSPSDQLKMINILARASGSLGMCGGQGIDLYSVGQELTLPELEMMHILKTGALIRAAVLLGSYCGTPLSDEARNALDHYAKCVGLAFQVVDDILDCEADSATLGKTAGKDAANNKPTYVALLGMKGAKEKAEELKQAAFDALAPFGEKAKLLHALAGYIVDRKY